jgi:hypothetical protein
LLVHASLCSFVAHFTVKLSPEWYLTSTALVIHQRIFDLSSPFVAIAITSLDHLTEFDPVLKARDGVDSGLSLLFAAEGLAADLLLLIFTRSPRDCVIKFVQALSEASLPFSRHRLQGASWDGQILSVAQLKPVMDGVLAFSEILNKEPTATRAVKITRSMIYPQRVRVPTM